MSQSTQAGPGVFSPWVSEVLVAQHHESFIRIYYSCLLESHTPLEPDPGTKSLHQASSACHRLGSSTLFSGLPFPANSPHRDSLYPISRWKGTSFVKNVLGIPTGFCFAIVLRCSPFNQRGLGYSEGGTFPPVAGECVNSQCVSRAYKNIFFFVVVVFIQHSLCNCQLQAQEKAVKSFFSLLLIELCMKRKERVWGRWCKRSGKRGFSRYCAGLLTHDVTLQCFVSSGCNKCGMHA